MKRAHFAPFFHNNVLVFQFIIKEFLAASKEMQNVVQLSNKIKSNNLSADQAKPLLMELSFSLSKLAGAKREASYQLPWNIHRGILTKLREHADLFAQSMNEDSMGYNLHDYFHKALLKCKLALDILNLKYEESSVDTSKICMHIEQAKREINRSAKLLVQTIFRFRENENVLYCLLRYSDRIEELYGKHFLRRLLRKMHPPTLAQVFDFLKKRYTERGFNYLIPSIEQKLLILEPITVPSSSI